MLAEAREEPLEIVAGELPGKRLGGLLATLLESDQAFDQNLKISEIIGGQDLPLHHREVDLDLVEPGGVSRKVDEAQVGPFPLQTLHASLSTVAGAVVHYPEHPLGGGVRLLFHDLTDKAAEGLDAVLRLATTEELRPVYIPGGQVSQSSLAFVLVLYTHRPPFTGGQARRAAISSLNGGLLVGADHVLSFSEGLVFPPTLVEVQHSRGFLSEIRIAREDPRAVVKRADGILAEPSPDGGARDLGHKAPINCFPRHFPGTPAAQRNPIGGWQLTSQRFHLHPRCGGKRGAVCRSGACPPVHPSPPRKSACATYTPFGEWCPAGRRFPCWRFPRWPTARSWRAPPPSRERCELRLASPGWRAHLWWVGCGMDFGWACKLSLLSDATSTKTLTRKENTSKKFSQRVLRRPVAPSR